LTVIGNCAKKPVSAHSAAADCVTPALQDYVDQYNR